MTNNQKETLRKNWETLLSTLDEMFDEPRVSIYRLSKHLFFVVTDIHVSHFICLYVGLSFAVQILKKMTSIQFFIFSDK